MVTKSKNCFLHVFPLPAYTGRKWTKGCHVRMQSATSSAGGTEHRRQATGLRMCYQKPAPSCARKQHRTMTMPFPKSRDQKDQEMTGKASATSKQRWWPECPMLRTEQGPKKTGQILPPHLFWGAGDLQTYLILFPYLGLSRHSLSQAGLRSKWHMDISGESIYNILGA